jgi:hypothetical protein
MNRLESLSLLSSRRKQNQKSLRHKELGLTRTSSSSRGGLNRLWRSRHTLRARILATNQDGGSWERVAASDFRQDAAEILLERFSTYLINGKMPLPKTIRPARAGRRLVRFSIVLCISCKTPACVSRESQALQSEPDRGPEATSIRCTRVPTNACTSCSPCFCPSSTSRPPGKRLRLQGCERISKIL